jgi:hypothetical protein
VARNESGRDGAVMSADGDITGVLPDRATALCGWEPKWPFSRERFAGPPRGPPVAQHGAPAWRSVPQMRYDPPVGSGVAAREHPDDAYVRM